MCNVLSKLSTIRPFIQGRSVHELYPARFNQTWPYAHVQPSCCISCRRPMAYEEMYPSGRLTPRAMCSLCYSKWDYFVRATKCCRVCGGQLEDWRVKKFKRNPREVENRLHDGKCLDYFVLLSVKALGQDTGVAENYLSMPPRKLQQPGIHPGHMPGYAWDDPDDFDEDYDLEELDDFGFEDPGDLVTNPVNWEPPRYSRPHEHNGNKVKVLRPKRQ